MEASTYMVIWHMLVTTEKCSNQSSQSTCCTKPLPQPRVVRDNGKCNGLPPSPSLTPISIFVFSMELYTRNYRAILIPVPDTWPGTPLCQSSWRHVSLVLLVYIKLDSFDASYVLFRFNPTTSLCPQRDYTSPLQHVLLTKKTPNDRSRSVTC
jgi:hypothetical protein